MAISNSAGRKAVEFRVPNEFLPIYDGAVGLYPHIAEESPTIHSPFGYQMSDLGQWACDGDRLHVEGNLPDRYWSRLLSPVNHSLLNYYEGDVLRARLSEDQQGFIGLSSLQGGFNGLKEGALPHGFSIWASYLREALDFLLGADEGTVCVWYAQGIFELCREEEHEQFDQDGSLIGVHHVRFDRRCYIAGFREHQWRLPIDHSEILQASLRASGFPGVFTNALRPLNAEPTFEEKVVAIYPLPLAYPYHQAMGATSAMAEYRTLLRTGENLLAFLAVLCLALVSPSDRAGLADEGKRAWVGGASPGHWLALLRASSILLETSNSELGRKLAHSLRARGKAGGVGEILDSIATTKNNFKHDRAVTSEEAARAENPRAHAAINEAYERLAYLCAYPIRYVSDLDFDSEKRVFSLETLTYSGASPHPRKEVIEWQEALSRNRLYVQESGLSWVPLDPFLHREFCPECRETELFFLENLPGKGAAVLRSFERGHTTTLPNYAPVVGRWFGR